VVGRDEGGEAASTGRRTLLLLTAVVVALGLGLRVWIYLSSIGHLGTDEATWGLMARHVLHGEVSAFFWGQSYGGTQEVFPVAALFWLFGTHLALMRIVPVVLSFVAAAVVWRTGRRSLGPVPGLVAGLLMLIWPVYAVWKLEVWSGFYGGGLLYSALVLLLTIMIDEDPTSRRIALMGLVIGLSFWESVQTVAVIIPALAWLTLRRPRVWTRSFIAIPGLLLGALPWLLSNLRHDWWSFSPLGGSGTYVSRLHGYVAATFPMMLGLRVPFAVEWVAGRAVSAALYLVAVALLLVAAWRWRRQPRSLFPFVVLVYPLFYAADALTSNTGEPRYLVVLLPALALVFASLASSVPRALLVVGVASVVSAVGLVRWLEWHGSPARATPYNPGEVDLWPMIGVLRQAGIDRAYADYSVAYRLTFDTREQIIVSEADLGHLAVAGPGRVLPPLPTNYTMHHHPAYDTDVRTARRFAYIFVRREPSQAADVSLLREHGFSEQDVGSLILLVSPPQPRATAASRAG
jgi:Dolichyl-phosphate-mannose-protein mannosyltransferase